MERLNALFNSRLTKAHLLGHLCDLSIRVANLVSLVQDNDAPVDRQQQPPMCPEGLVSGQDQPRGTRDARYGLAHQSRPNGCPPGRGGDKNSSGIEGVYP